MKNSARQAAAFGEQVGTDPAAVRPFDENTAAEAADTVSALARIAPLPTRDGDSALHLGQPISTEAGSMKQSPIRGWMVALLVIVAGVVAWLVLRGPSTAAPPATPVASAPLELASVDVVAVEARVLSRSSPLSGSMSPVVQATVKSKVSGEVEQVTVREGQDVQQGDVIARIDTRNLQAQYDREMAAVDKARADLNLATLNRDKNRMLLEQHYISQNTYEATESAYAGNVASLKLAEAEARVAKIGLDDAIIRAPFAGTIAKRMVQPGEKVSSDTSIFSLVDLRQMLLEAALPAADIPAVRIGQKARFKVGGFGDREFEGEIQRINPVTTDGSRAITIYIAVANPDRALKGGMFAQGDLTLEATQPVLSIPVPAMHDDSGMAFVYTLQEGKITRRPVSLGPVVKGNGYVEVRTGLSAGERVIVADIGDAKSGASAFVRGEQAAKR
ncbi:MAG TPA: efflux RND transporter periplasmic adaptor subunit [Steroidobacteraceae bacterium]